VSTPVSGSSSSTGSTAAPISFGGLVSGLNTQSIINAMMQAAQAPVNLLKNEQAAEQNRLQAYQDLNTKLQALQATASTLGLQSTTGAKQVSFTGPSGTYASGTATADALSGSFQLQIDQLATATKVVSLNGVGGAVLGTDLVVNNSKTQSPITAGTFTVNDTVGGSTFNHTITVAAGSTFSSVMTDIQNALQADFGAGASATLGADNKLHLNSGGAGTIQVGGGGDTSNFLVATKLIAQPAAATLDSSGPVGVTNSTVALNSANIAGLTSTTTGSILINGVSIGYDTTRDTLNDVLNRINASTAKVTASYDPNSDTVTLTSTQTGNTDITISDGNGNLASSLQVTAGGAHHLGQSAKYEVNGGAAQYSLSNTIKNVVSGVNVTLTAPTPSALTVNVSQDSSVGEGAIKAFATAYNAVVDTINKDTAYDSTTKTAGILMGDSAIEDLQMQLNDGLFIENGGSLGLTPGFQTLTSIGISTGAIGSAPGTTNDLTFDTSAFESALNSNPTAVTNLVTKVFGNLNTSLLNITAPGGLVDSAIQSENTQIADFQTQIDDQNQIIQQQQDFLNQEFSSLETQLAQLQSQSSAGISALSSFSVPSSSGSSNLTSTLLGNGTSTSGTSGASSASGG